ncbi:MAG: leader peptide processing enzyme [Spirochaetales bacterium]|jgi:hypothetical protein|nr:leader peptide processing enzyme [Spirochaetales bacterium]
MNKKVNTALFIVAASVLNVVMMMVLFILALGVLGALLSEDTSPASAQFFMLLAFIFSIGGSYGLYTLLIQFISKKIDMEKYFHPVFRRRPKH